MTSKVKLKFTLKEADVGGWIAKCPNLPEFQIYGEEVPTVLRGIQDKLEDTFKDATNIEGGITALVAEYNIVRRAEVPLTAFTDTPSEELKQSIAELKKEGVTVTLEDPRTDRRHKMNEGQKIKQRLAELMDDDDEYQWHRITELEAGCAICKGLLNGCKGNKEGEPCNSYCARDNCGDTCQMCTRSDKTKNYCRKHKAKIDPRSDFCCHEFNERREAS